MGYHYFWGIAGLRRNGDAQTSFLNVHVSPASAKSCPTANKLLQAPHVLVLSLVQLTEAADDVHEMMWGESFVAEILCQVFLKLLAAAVL